MMQLRRPHPRARLQQFPGGRNRELGPLVPTRPISWPCTAVVLIRFVPGAGHLPVLEQPDETTAALLGWLDA